jgi:hypothetical protein
LLADSQETNRDCWGYKMAEATHSRYVKLTKDQVPVEDIKPGELNQPIEVPQVFYFLSLSLSLSLSVKLLIVMGFLKTLLLFMYRSLSLGVLP